MFRVARNLNSCHTRINVSTKETFPAPAKSVKRYHAILKGHGTTRCGFRFRWTCIAFNLHAG